MTDRIRSHHPWVLRLRHHTVGSSLSEELSASLCIKAGARTDGTSDRGRNLEQRGPRTEVGTSNRRYLGSEVGTSNRGWNLEQRLDLGQRSDPKQRVKARVSCTEHRHVAAHVVSFASSGPLRLSLPLVDQLRSHRFTSVSASPRVWRHPASGLPACLAPGPGPIK